MLYSIGSFVLLLILRLGAKGEKLPFFLLRLFLALKKKVFHNCDERKTKQQRKTTTEKKSTKMKAEKEGVVCALSCARYISAK